MPGPGLGWLIARPVAHRGLHDAQKGIIENTPSAFAAAIEQQYGIRLPRATKRSLAYFGHALRTRPQFLAYAVSDLPSAIPTVARRLFGLPLPTWTVRTAADREKAARYADQMIFEGFRP